jgi:ribosomal protein L40E
MRRLFRPGGPSREEVTIARSSAGGGPPPASARNRKSVLVALVCNLVPGAGVIYAGDRVGVLYVLIVIGLLILSPLYPFFPLAVVVALASYPHTVIAVNRWNQMIEEAERSLKPVLPPPSTFQSELSLKAPADILTRSCSECGAEVSRTATYCRMCGHRLDAMAACAPLPSLQATRSCPRCGASISQAARHCRICGQALDETRVW